jgi:hypothetical protein
MASGARAASTAASNIALRSASPRIYLATAPTTLATTLYRRRFVSFFKLGEDRFGGSDTTGVGILDTAQNRFVEEPQPPLLRSRLHRNPNPRAMMPRRISVVPP